MLKMSRGGFAMSTPAGWYEQPDGQQRYWDGTRWTQDLASGAGTTASTAAATATSPDAGAASATSGGPVGPTVQKKHLIGYVATGLFALVVGAGLGAGIDSVAKAGSQLPTPTGTITVATPGPTATTTVPGPTITKTTTATVTSTVTSTVTKQGPTRTVTVTPAPAPVPQIAAGAIPGDGTFEVGVDIQPGTYVSAPPAVNCYWARLSSSNTSDIIANNNSSGQSVVTIEPGDKLFESSGCSEWTRR
jgi:hypothetical protein